MTTETSGSSLKDRRQSSRWQLDRDFSWRAHGGRCVHEARVVERSLNGLVLETDHQRTLGLGKMIRPADGDAGLRHGYRLAIVRRIEPLDRGRDRVVIEILA